MQRITVICAVAATIAAVYFGLPRAAAAPDAIVQTAARLLAQDRVAARRWMCRLPADARSGEALLKLMATRSDSSAPALHALHALLDRRCTSAHAHDAEFVSRIAAALAEVARDSAMPAGAAAELATRLLEWPSDLGVHGPRVAEDCAAALQSAALKK